MTPERWQKIEELYHAALALREEQRTPYVNDACAGDSDLCREVLSLLSHGGTTDRFLETPAASPLIVSAPGADSAEPFVGREIGSYQIVSLIGAGGMGEVYEALDAKLHRRVAIKVLPAAFADDPERLTRFRREARMLAALNHPNIATIHGLEQAGTTYYLVMELVPGETLAQRLRSRPPQIDEALKLAAQIAEALESAHEKGVIHRDLKPANVKVTPQGRVKVLDFGLAKASTQDTGVDLSAMSTVTAAGTSTEDGRILGTPAYMSPEQARGKPVDKRTDIWAFGCVLYELLTAKQAFPGKTIPDVIAAVLEREPNWQILPASTPPGIRALLRRCLHKEPQRRLRDIGDARIEIEEAQAAPVEPALSRNLRGIRWGMASVFLAAMIAGIVVWSLKTKPARELQPPARMVITPPGEPLLGGEAGTPVLALSPDGTSLVSVIRHGSTTQLYRRRLDQLEFVPIAGTEGAVNPFFSPDSQWIGFYSVPERKIEKVSAAGGVPQIVCDTGQIDGVAWGPNDLVVFSSGLRGNFGLYQVPAAGGTPRVLTTIDPGKGEIGHSWPELLPDGKSILFVIRHSAETADSDEIVVQSLETGDRRVLVEGGTLPRYAPSGHLIYARAGTLMAAPFSLARLKLTGASVAVQDGLVAGNSIAQFTFSNLGWLIYRPSADADKLLRELVWVDRKGVAQRLDAPPRRYQFPRLSPNGRSIAVQATSDKADIWIYDLERDTLTRLTSEGTNYWPLWTPDGKRVVFTSNRGGPDNLYWKLADGSGPDERLTTSQHVQEPRSWTSDGQQLVFQDTDPTTNDDLWVLPLQGDRKPWPFLRTPFPEGWARLSPDGRWLAYVSKELARTEVYVQAFPQGGGRTQISTSGATEPVWSHSGRELFYRSGDKLMAVDIATQPAFSAAKPRLLFESTEYEGVSTTPNYDVSLDDQRFLMVHPVEQSPAQYNVVLNWFDDLKRRVPPTNDY